jgi:hypothetical protein
MAKYFLLVKRKSRKNYDTIIPAKKNATKSQLQKLIKTIKKGYTAKIVTLSQLKNYTKSLAKHILKKGKK